MTRLFSRTRAAARDRRGAATVEFVFWIPFFLGLLALIVDVSLLLNMRAQMLDAATSAARYYALRIGPADEARDFAKDMFPTGVADVTVTTDIDDKFVTAEVRVPYSKAMLFGRDLAQRGFFNSDELYIRMTMPVNLAVDPGTGEPTGAYLAD
ncbi:TadE/TadG family type IV pilus assembly protein [Rhodovulum sp. DZ06]|uniref:TadE/TadG family type IV pilus assembly protein n=1 Tax=Rhodovulum sp. DZ06 TaxID=3425126 RepID=UPI003D336220